MKFELNEKKSLLIVALVSLFINAYVKGAGLATFNAITSMVVYAVFLLMGLYVCIDLLSKRYKIWQIIVMFILLGISFLGKGTVALTLLILVGLFVIHITDKDIMEIFRISLTLDVIASVLMSICRITPLYSKEGMVTFGFVNQNGIAFYFAIATILWIRKARSIGSILLATVAVCIEATIMYFYWSCQTGALILVGFWALFLLLKINAWRALKYVLTLTPLIFFLFVITVGAAYSEVNGLDGLNESLNERPFIWNQYITNAGFRYFGASIDVTEAEFGPIDGTYLATPLEYGIVWIVFLILALIRLNLILGKNKQWDILALAIIMEISGASETKLALIYGTPVIILSIKYICQDSRLRRKYEGVKQ